ncbi:hypothetical protein MIND_00190400 [Mycena indigotica]|uniref:Uncharacterized protein n=1 Tax=Mycena indigotica TaxID=2126181 RepID=A0A8H6WGT5_9AGAR|nr:uncharacterized protein MIND_00190400 [Mycena indigotica]KAF7311799.1 hypothetical protein MIND_00190400 [Mycena indigotica]
MTSQLPPDPILAFVVPMLARALQAKQQEVETLTERLRVVSETDTPNSLSDPAAATQPANQPSDVIALETAHAKAVADLALAKFEAEVACQGQDAARMEQQRLQKALDEKHVLFETVALKLEGEVRAHRERIENLKKRGQLMEADNKMKSKKIANLERINAMLRQELDMAEAQNDVAAEKYAVLLQANELLRADHNADVTAQERAMPSVNPFPLACGPRQRIQVPKVEVDKVEKGAPETTRPPRPELALTIPIRPLDVPRAAHAVTSNPRAHFIGPRAQLPVIPLTSRGNRRRLQLVGAPACNED